MVKLALLATLEAKPGKEQEVADCIKSALSLAEQEEKTVSWYGLQLGPSTFGIFDTFENEEGRMAHFGGPQYEHVDQVINNTQASSTTGLAIHSTISGNNFTVNVNVSYSQPLDANAKLTVYLVEDKLYFTQRNYSSNLHNGQNYISNLNIMMCSEK